MQWLVDAWHWLWSQYVNWDLVLRFLQVLIWPFITLIGLFMVRPGRIVTALLENGGELGLGPVSARFGKRVEEIAQSVDEDEQTRSDTDPPAQNPLQDAADPYTTVLNGWGKVVEGLEAAVERGHLPALNKRDPMTTVASLRRADLIGRRLEHNIQDLWDFRNKVVRAGSHRLERLGLSQLQADDYYASADKVRRGILRALSYRESKGSLASFSDRTSDGQSPSQLN